MLRRIALFVILAGAAACGGDSSSGVGDICGGLIGLDCPDDLFCEFSGGTCGAADQTGICQRRPDACAEIFAPVCACNNTTFGNECFARAAGVSIVSDGECTEPKPS